jgi:hypothetical protein
LTVESDVPEREPAIRTRRPTPTRVTIEIPDEQGLLERAERLELFSTTRSREAWSETRLVGVAKYPDSDGRWSVEFTTGNFATRSSGHLVLHAELLGPNGALLGVDAVGLID